MRKLEDSIDLRPRDVQGALAGAVHILVEGDVEAVALVVYHVILAWRLALVIDLIAKASTHAKQATQAPPTASYMPASR
jgi:hypothetical protein